jgi:hypothetical protein
MHNTSGTGTQFICPAFRIDEGNLALNGGGSVWRRRENFTA